MRIDMLSTTKYITSALLSPNFKGFNLKTLDSPLDIFHIGPFLFGLPKKISKWNTHYFTWMNYDVMLHLHTICWVKALGFFVFFFFSSQYSYLLVFCYFCNMMQQQWCLLTFPVNLLFTITTTATTTVTTLTTIL